MRWSAAAFVALLSSLGTISCSGDSLGPGESTEDGSTDAAVSTPKELFEPPVWRALSKMSPENLEPPQDPTNRVAGNSRAEKLGQFLFYDERLSGEGRVSCATCHPPSNGFSDTTPFSETPNGTTGRHAPTLLNVGYAEWMFWDGRRDTLWNQAVVPLENPVEMAGSRLEVAHLIYRDDQLKEAYEEIFSPLPDLSDTDRFPEEGRPTSEETAHNENWESMEEEDRERINRITINVLKCIAAFEMKLVSMNAPFDTFVAGMREGDSGKIEEISDEAIEGARLFAGRAKCTGCHSGPTLSDEAFHNVGFREGREDLGRKEGIKKWRNSEFHAASEYSDAPNGVQANRVKLLSSKEGGEGAIKTPPLRNVSKTAPYGHSGAFDSLMEVLEFYNELPHKPAVGVRDNELDELNFGEGELKAIVAFLESLEGERISEKYRKQPKSPLP